MKTILFLAANPEDNDAHLALEREASEIGESLRRSIRRDEFRVESRWAVTGKVLQRAMLEVKPDIVHFCGHGAGKSGLALLDDHGELKNVTGEALASLFRLSRNTLKCVVLNSCYSEVQAKAIVEHTEYVIGMSSSITDSAAIKFSIGFYDGLGAGETIESAFDHGRVAIELEGLPEHLTPKLLTKKAIRKPIVPPPPPDTSGRCLSDPFYAQKIRDGWFTPFIGPMSYRTAGNMAKAVEHIGGRVTELLRHLEQPAQDYLTSVVQAKMPDALNVQNANSQASSPAVGLMELQRTLARLGSLATRLFAAGYVDKPSAVADAREVCVGLSGPSTELKALLLKACEFSWQACQHVPCPDAKSKRSSDPCFGGEARITEKLIGLALLMLPSEIHEHDFKPELRAKFEDVNPMGGVQGRPSALSIAQLEWLANLLWHTLRYDAPMYPQPGDLAFQLALCKEHAAPVSVRLGMAATALEDRVIRCVRHALKSCDKGVSGMPLDWEGFHAAIATALCQKRPDPHNRFVPLALLTTFDMELERVLTADRQSYHVLIPVYRGEEGSTQPEAAWLLYSPGGADDREESWYYMNAKYEYGDLAPRISGPLLVKLNGSPLHDLPESRFVDLLPERGADTHGFDSDLAHVRSSRFDHRIILSDYQLGEYLRSPERWPGCLGPLLGHGNRLLCFLGYDLGDPSDVFGIHAHVRGGDDEKGNSNRGKEQQVFLGAPLDTFRQGILSPLDMLPLKTTLDKVAPTILGLTGLRKLDTDAQQGTDHE